MRNDHLEDLEDVVEDAVERSISNVLARRAMPRVSFGDPGGDLAVGGNPFIETVVTNEDIRSRIRCHLSHIEEHYHIPRFRNGHYRAFREFVLSNEFQSRLPTDNEIVGFLFDEIPLLDPARHPFFHGLVDLLRDCVNSLNGNHRIRRNYRPGARSVWRNYVDPQDRHRFQELIPLNRGYRSDRHQREQRRARFENARRGDRRGRGDGDGNRRPGGGGNNGGWGGGSNNGGGSSSGNQNGRGGWGSGSGGNNSGGWSSGNQNGGGGWGSSSGGNNSGGWGSGGSNNGGGWSSGNQNGNQNGEGGLGSGQNNGGGQQDAGSNNRGQGSQSGNQNNPGNEDNNENNADSPGNQENSEDPPSPPTRVKAYSQEARSEILNLLSLFPHKTVSAYFMQYQMELWCSTQFFARNILNFPKCSRTAHPFATRKKDVVTTIILDLEENIWLKKRLFGRRDEMFVFCPRWKPNETSLEANCPDHMCACNFIEDFDHNSGHYDARYVDGPETKERKFYMKFLLKLTDCHSFDGGLQHMCMYDNPDSIEEGNLLPCFCPVGKMMAHWRKYNELTDEAAKSANAFLDGMFCYSCDEEFANADCFKTPQNLLKHLWDKRNSCPLHAMTWLYLVRLYERCPLVDKIARKPKEELKGVGLDRYDANKLKSFPDLRQKFTQQELTTF